MPTALKAFYLLSFINAFQVPLLLPDSPAIRKSDTNDTVVSSTLQTSPISKDNSTRTWIANQRLKVSLTGGHDTCFKANLAFTSSSTSVTLTLAIDSGSSDTAIPLNNLVGNEGKLSLAYSYKNDAKKAKAVYGDGSWWEGILINDVNVSIPSSTINSRAPIYGIVAQSLNPVFVNGIDSNGLMGIAFGLLSRDPSSNPPTVMDGWLKNQVIQNDIITFHGCPYSNQNEAYIDFGNETAYTACGNVKATVKIPNPSYYNLNVIDVSINGSKVPLQSDFQSNGMYSILDSCTSNILVPQYILDFLQDQVVGYFGLSLDFQSGSYFDSFMNGEIWIEAAESNFIWEKLPNISITIDSGFDAYSSVTLVIGPRQYIQADETGTKWTFMVKAQNDAKPYIILGLPYFSAFHIILDRGQQQVTFSPGCGCNTKDQYPLILTDNRFKYCTTNSTASTTSTAAWACQTYTPWMPAVTSTISTNTNQNSVMSLQHSSHHELPSIEIDENGLFERSSSKRSTSKRSQEPLANRAGCYTAQFNISGIVFNMLIDSGSSDMAVPYEGLNNYQGVSLNSFSAPFTKVTPQVYAKYSDGTGWIGNGKNLTVGIPHTNISSLAPVYLMTQQTEAPLFVDGLYNVNGLAGIAFPAIAIIKNVFPPTVIDAWYASNVIQNNEIAIHGCPGVLSERSFIDFGNEKPLQCAGDGCNQAVVNITDPGFYSFKLGGINIGGYDSPLPSDFQIGESSILDSCSTSTILPESIVATFRKKILESNGLSKSLTQQTYYTQVFLNATHTLQVSNISLIISNWSALPNISFTINTNRTSLGYVKLVLGPRQYIQSDSTGLYWGLSIRSDLVSFGKSANFAILGLPFFNAFHVVLDRQNAQIKFQPGCGCNASLDHYPKIITEPSDEAESAWSCSSYTEPEPLVPPNSNNDQVPSSQSKNVFSFLNAIAFMLSLFVIY